MSFPIGNSNTSKPRERFIPNPKLNLLDQVSEVMRLKHYSRVLIHEKCRRLIATLPELQHDPNRPEDVLKVDADENGAADDDAPDALRYLVASLPRKAGFMAV